MPRPSTIALFSTIPTANPARSYSPLGNAFGCSAVSPPISAHRVAKFPGNCEKRAEPPDAGEHFRPRRPLREGLDRLDQRVAGIDVHSGVAVSDRLLAGQDWGLQIKWRVFAPEF